ncbi:MAG: 3-oxoacyl-[acyl-carrier-protein] reductase [Alphaproteobacteria bacterium]
MKKNALITGATGGIGLAIVEVLSKKFNLILVARNEKKLDEISSKNNSILKCMKCDLSDVNEIKVLTEKIIKDKINVDILVNNAGINNDSLFLRMNSDKWEDVIKTNLTSNFHLTNQISKLMIKQRWGRIINITSVVGHTGNLGQANYSASKAGIIGMSKSIALELAKRNITVNCISPGFIESNMTDLLSENQKESILKKIPLESIGSPYDVAYCVNFLASEESRYITGETIHVNGGLAML